MAILSARPFFESAQKVETDRLKQESLSLAIAMPAPAQTKFSVHLDNCWSDARDAKRPVQRRMLKAAKNKKGEYEESKLAAIRATHAGSEAFVPATGLKCTAARDYLADIFTATERPFAIQPTPIPSLPLDLQMEVITRVQAEIMMHPNGANLTPEEIDELDKRATKDVMDALKKDARERAERMETQVDDVLTEGGWKDALAEVIDDVVTYPAGILKGPVLRMKPQMAWVQSPDGNWSITVKNTLSKEFERTSPFDLYPQRNIRDINDGYCFERLRLNRRKLNELKGLKGYDDKEIDAVLVECQTGQLKGNWLWDTDSEADSAEERDFLQDSPEGRVDGLEFWGSVPGQWLLDWGMSPEKIKDPNREYQITAIKVGSHIIRCTLNPHPLFMKPYHVVSWRKTPGAFWGQGIPEIVEDIQEILNAVVRALVNNVAIASGPQCAMDVSQLPVGTNYKFLTPWKIHMLDSSRNLGMGGNGNNKLPIEFFQPDMHADILLRVVNAFMQMMDEYTGIPAYMTGDSQTGGAAGTSSGLKMLMGAAGKIIKNIAAKIDAYLVVPTVLRVFTYEMLYNPDNSIKGDAQIVARGSGAIIAKEQELVRMLELLNLTRNDIDMQVIGLPGRAQLLKDVFHRFNLNLDHIIPDVEELMRKEEIMQMQILQKEQRRTGNLDSASPRTLDNAGQPAGGTDNALMMPRPGQAQVAA